MSERDGQAAGGRLTYVLDCKSDVDPSAATVGLYREQVTDYLAGTGGKEGLVMFVTTGRVERVVPR